MKRFPRIAIIALSILAVSYALLLVPEEEYVVPVSQGDEQRPFLWNQDAVWDSLETSFQRARAVGCDDLAPLIDAAMRELRVRIEMLNGGSFAASDPLLREMEAQLFFIGPLVAACPEHVPAYTGIVSDMRTAIKRQSQQWDMQDRNTREILYRLLYGGRMALEEVMLQTPESLHCAPLLLGTAEPSSTPAAMFQGVTIRSGDILLSRGGAPTSALIARGNDFPGNFSHVALVHVEPGTHEIRIIESHIERGVAIATPEEYLKDTKLRILVLRLRSTVPGAAADPLLPHRAAEYALQRATDGHIPYDFRMDFASGDKLFCSEVASEAYAKQGVALWMGVSHISSTGLRQWLADFGVRNFATQEPSDLEYDPQLSIVAEWRDVETLRKDHIDNAVTEAMLERADSGAALQFNPWLLPVARLAKAYSMLLNVVHLTGPIPEGMSATSALKNEWYSQLHNGISKELRAEHESFLARNGYAPPYWEYLRMARARVKERMNP